MATYDLTQNIPSSIVTGDILNCPYSGSPINITLPAGSYKLECWGAQGGYNTNSAAGGKGGYSVGNITFDTSTSIYIYTGGQGTPALTTGNTATGGFNGGGNACGSSWGRASGGGGSDIRLIEDSLYARVIVAGGGGGSVGLSASMATEYTTTIGHGGGTSGVSGVAVTGTSQGLGTGGGQSSAGTNSTTSGIDGSFGLGGGSLSSTIAGGGGGWYGGAGGSGPGGGSGYIYTSSTASSYPSGCLLESSYYLTNASTIAGNNSFTSPTGTSETGHSGDGYVRITVLSISGGDTPTPTPTERVYDLSQDLVSLTNLIPDGDIEGNWTNGNYSTTIKKYASRSQYFTSGTTRIMTKAMNTLPIVGHKYYGRHYLKTDGSVNADDCRFEWYAGDGEGLNFIFGYNRGNYSDWTMESNIVTVTAVNGSSYECRSFMVNPTGTLYADGLMIVDLTAAFGSGNEPTKDWCDTNIPFFVGTTYICSSLPTSYKKGDILNIPYTGHRISIELPKKYYKIECWGAQGGSYSSTYIGGKGGYSVGTLNLPKQSSLHLYAGGQGSLVETTSTIIEGGFNGGGGAYTTSTTYKPGTGGGGTDVRIETDSLYARVIVAGGGGGSYGYSSWSGGAGGGTSGVAGTGSSNYTGGGAGTSTSAGISYYGTTANSTSYGTLATFGAGGTPSASYSSGGGGGWYGGGYSRRAAAGGGSGYVYTADSASNYPSGCLLNNNYYLLESITAADTREGNGYIKITITEKPKPLTIQNFEYTGTVQPISLPKGKYKLECWGASGGDGESTTASTERYGGKGGYSTGILTLTSNTTLYIYVGGQGGSTDFTATPISGGFNGGGGAQGSTKYKVGAGGGASDIRIDQDSLYSRVIVAGGGGGGNGGTTTGGHGGYGGGTTGGPGISTAGSYGSTYEPGGGGTQTAGGSGGYNYALDGVGSFGAAPTTVASRVSGAGGGWYGGGIALYVGSGGGSGYIYTTSTESNYPSGCLLNSSYFLETASTISGNDSFTDPDGSTVTGHSGNGYVRITNLTPPLNFHIKVNGDWVEVASGFVKISGEWKEIVSAHTKINGTWTE
jgi:hypothetical protein